MRNSFYLLVFIFLNYSCQQKEQALTPLLDGKIDEYKELKIQPVSLSEDVSLYIYQNKHYVWLAYDYPDGSYGTLDMEIKTDALEKPLNLHISAQLGEWEVGDEEKTPKESNSNLWWEINGWYANEVWFNGTKKVEGQSRMNFKNAPAREIQLSKKRFGNGDWKLKFNIRSIQGKDGEKYSINFPQNKEEYYTVKVD